MIEPRHRTVDALEREQAEKVNLDRVRYLAGEVAHLEDPDTPLPVVGGPLDGCDVAPIPCGCVRRCGGATWPVRMAAEGGEYVLNLVWLADDEPDDEEAA